MIKEFRRAATAAEAMALRKEGFAYLAGGTQINNASSRVKGEPVEKVVSLDSLGLRDIIVEKDRIRLGAMVTIQQLVDASGLPDALRQAAGFIPTRSVRNMATIGGNIGAGRSDSYLVPVLWAFEASAELGDGSSLPVEQYVTSGDDRLISQIVLPLKSRAVAAVKESRSHLALPVVSAAVSLTADKGRLSKVIIAAGCLSSRCLRLGEIEEKLRQGSLAFGPELEQAIEASLDPRADILGSVEYKRYINGVRIADALRACRKEILP